MHVSFLNEIKMLLIVAPVKITVVKPTQSPPVTDIFGSTPATSPPEHTTNLTGNLTNSTTSTLVEIGNSTTVNVSDFFVFYRNAMGVVVLHGIGVHLLECPCILYIWLSYFSLCMQPLLNPYMNFVHFL